MKTQNIMKILADVKIEKLREYSRSYGQPTTIDVPFVFEYENEIQILSATGDIKRTMRKGTKLLICFKGSEISHRAFKIRTNRAKKAFEKNKKETEEKQRILNEKIEKIRNGQKQVLRSFLLNNPEKIEKLISWHNTFNSHGWRSRMHRYAAKHANNGTYDGLALTPPDVRELAYELQSELK